MRDATPLEASVLHHFLSGDHPTLQLLRVQADAATVSSRDFTGVGVYVNFSVPHTVPHVSPPDLILGDVNLELVNAEPGVCALLYVERGVLSVLELVTSAGPWPDDPQIHRITYFTEVPMENGFSLIPREARHPEALARALLGRRGKGAA